ncbi:MAG: methyltransferase domain-containing protein [Actinobacteria bacterium]|nr:MAG: methyltransferase domain-containing protein [Actinomycetota bacterium]
MHSHDSARSDIEGSVIHASRSYDAFAWFIRRTDGPILDLAEIREGDRVLDIGTGPGYLARAAAERVGDTGRAVGLDASPEMIEQATARAKQEGSTAEFVLAGAQEMPFEDGSFDAVVSRLALHHIPAAVKERAIEEIARVLAPGGRVVLVDLREQTLGALLHAAVRRLHSAEPLADDGSLTEVLKIDAFAGLETGRISFLSYARARRRSE